MNVQKVYEDIKSRSDLDDYVLMEFARQCGEFFDELKSDLDVIAPYEAIDVLSLLTYSEAYWGSGSEWEQSIYRCLEKIRDGIYAGSLLSLAVFGGLSHIKLVISELSHRINSLNRFISNLNTILETRIKSYIDVKKSGFHTSGSYELITGLSGILRCCLDAEPAEEYQKLSNDIIDALIERLKPKKHLGHAVPGFYYFPSEYEKQHINNPSENGYINYGISHGMAGPLCTLAIAYRRGIYSNKIRPVLEYLIDELLKARFYVNNIVYWPGKISFEQYIGKSAISHMPNRMSWCYGSIGILRSLYTAGKALSSKEICTYSVEEMKKIAELDTKKYLFRSPIICHGVAGAALVMKKMYVDTKDCVFDAKQRVLQDDLVRSFAYRHIESTDRTEAEEVTKYNYLDGYAGILQTIFCDMRDISNINEKRLLLL